MSPIADDVPANGAKNVDLHLVQSRELAQATEDRVEEARWKAQLGTLAARTELMLQQQHATAMLNRWN